MSGGEILDKIKIDLRNYISDNRLTIYIDIWDNSLSRKWLSSLNNLLEQNYHLEKNYCFLGFSNGPRNGEFIVQQINQSIRAINAADLGYHINDIFSMENCLKSGPVGDGLPGRKIIDDKFNRLHRYFEDLQGVSGKMSPYAQLASPEIKWHIRQLNLLCHEFESWALSYRKADYAPEWERPSQLMCWLSAPRFVLEDEDYKLFGIDTINRPTGGVFVGVNKAVGKHHYEVYQDEGRSVDELITSTLRSQTEAAGDFDIEWGMNPENRVWQIQHLINFRQWLVDNGFDPEDPKLTIGHPQIGQVDLEKSFGTSETQQIWSILEKYLDVYSITTSTNTATYDYHWSDDDFIKKQIAVIAR